MAVTLVTHLLLNTQPPLVSAQRWEVVSGSKRAIVANTYGIISKGDCDSPSIAFALVGVAVCTLLHSMRNHLFYLVLLAKTSR